MAEWVVWTIDVDSTDNGESYENRHSLSRFAPRAVTVTHSLQNRLWDQE